MTEKVKQFLIELSKDPVKMEDFWKNPDAFLNSSDLSDEERDILRSGDSERIQGLLGALTQFWASHWPPPDGGDNHNQGPHRRPEKPKKRHV